MPETTEFVRRLLLDTGDVYAEWDATDGVIRLYDGRSTTGELAYHETYIVSPKEIRQIAAWVEEHHLE